MNDATSPVTISLAPILPAPGSAAPASPGPGLDASVAAVPVSIPAIPIAPIPIAPCPVAGAAEGALASGPAEPARKARVPVEWGTLPFLIRRDGTWLYRGSPIPRKELVCLFASVLRRDADGAWRLETPAERGRIEVEDAPFVAVELDWSGDGRQQIMSFRTNIDQVVAAGPDHPIRVSHDVLTSEPVPYILLRDGDGAHGIEARIGRAVYYELVALAVPEYVGTQLMLGVWSSGVFFPLGLMPSEDGEDEF